MARWLAESRKDSHRLRPGGTFNYQRKLTIPGINFSLIQILFCQKKNSDFLRFSTNFPPIFLRFSPIFWLLFRFFLKIPSSVAYENSRMDYGCWRELPCTMTMEVVTETCFTQPSRVLIPDLIHSTHGTTETQAVMVCTGCKQTLWFMNDFFFYVVTGFTFLDFHAKVIKVNGTAFFTFLGTKQPVTVMTESDVDLYITGKPSPY